MAQFDSFASVPPPRAGSPWGPDGYEADLDRLNGLLSACVREGSWRAQQAGDLGLALDLWVADELRRGGYETDAVWPRATDPRILPAAVARAISRLPKAQQIEPVVGRIVKTAGASGAVVQGEFFAKAVDVVVADWDRGVELLVSTKAMIASFGKNLTNRWEEFVGDLRNLRGRFPLAVLGVCYLADESIIEDEPNAFARLLDMLRKLRSETWPGRAYDASMLIIARPEGEANARLSMDRVPPDLAAGQFFEALLTRAFERLPVSERAEARRLYGRDTLPTAEAEPAGGPEGPLPDDDGAGL